MTADSTVTGQNGASNGTANANGTPRTKICVFCGSSAGNDPEHVETARELARVMAENDIDLGELQNTSSQKTTMRHTLANTFFSKHLVYGGGTVGLMGEVAKTLCELKGPDAIHGIIPEALVKYERNDTYQTINTNNQYVPTESTYGRTTVVKDMHTRKKLMAEEVFNGGPGSGFIALSGGYGTVEELFEVVTWNQLGIHKRGICMLNINGYWDGIIQWVDKAVEQGFVKLPNKDILVTATTAEDAILGLMNYQGSEGTFKLEWGTQ